MSSYSSSSCHGDSESESEFNPKDEANDNLDDSNEENDSNEEKKQYDSNEENESNEEEENDSNEEEEYLSDEQDSSNIYESEPNVVDHIVHADNATTHHLYYNIDETPITFIPYKRREEIGRHGILMPSINCRGQAEIRTQFLDYNVTSIGSGISNNIMIRGFGIKGIHCIIHVINDVVYIEDKTFTKTINVSSDKLPLLSSKKNPSTNIVAPAFKELHSGSYIDLTQHIRFYYYDINGIEPKENANIVVYKIDDADTDIKLIINSNVVSLDTTQFNSENMSNVLFEFLPSIDICMEISSWSFGNINEHISWLIGTTRSSEKPERFESNSMASRIQPNDQNVNFMFRSHIRAQMSKWVDENDT